MRKYLKRYRYAIIYNIRLLSITGVNTSQKRSICWTRFCREFRTIRNNRRTWNVVDYLAFTNLEVICYGLNGPHTRDGAVILPLRYRHGGNIGNFAKLLLSHAVTLTDTLYICAYTHGFAFPLINFFYII